MNLLTKNLVAIALASSLLGCATVDFDQPKEESFALPPAETASTHLGRQIVPEVKGHSDGESGFVPFHDGIDALAIRLLLAERAEKTIDAQYYLLKRGVTGSAFVHSLLDAADRGVRVRLLLDDMFTGGYDAGMAGLNTHPNIEIRIFNPFANRSARFAGGLWDFSRINRRMHNKSFTVDGQMTLIGGRNIADEYFGAREDATFGDLDVLGIGPVVQDISATFDEYWNHERAAPVDAFAKMPDDPAAELVRLRATLDTAREDIKETKYAAAVGERVESYIDSDSDEFIWAPYVVAVDSPDKNIKSKANTADSITTPLIESLSSSKKEILIVSPYFVPMKTGVESLVAIQENGVQVTILTNSLAANNQATVHGGYAPSRKPLLKAGVKIYEVRPDAHISGSELLAASGAKATLHTKAFVVDREQSFIGSFNFDPRSANINTELGTIIHSPEISNDIVDGFDSKKAAETFEVFLNEKGKLRWRAMNNGEEVIYKKEPQTTWGQRFMAGFYRIMPIRGQL